MPAVVRIDTIPPTVLLHLMYWLIYEPCLLGMLFLSASSVRLTSGVHRSCVTTHGMDVDCEKARDIGGAESPKSWCGPEGVPHIAISEVTDFDIHHMASGDASAYHVCFPMTPSYSERIKC